MNPGELEFFCEFLLRKEVKMIAELGDLAFSNVIHIQHTMGIRRTAFQSLSPCQQQTWNESYAVPIFDKSQRLVDFIVDYESIEFDQQVGSSTEASMDEAEQIIRIPYCHTGDCPADDETVVPNLNWGGDGNFEVRRNRVTQLFGIYGGPFEGYAQVANHTSTLRDSKIKLLQDGEFRIANLRDRWWELVEGPLTQFHGVNEQLKEVPDIQSAYQSSAHGPTDPTDNAAPKVTKYACLLCEIEPGTSRTATPASVDPQEGNSDETDNDSCDHCEACEEPRTDDATNDASTKSDSGISCFCTHWDIPVDRFGATFET